MKKASLLLSFAFYLVNTDAQDSTQKSTEPTLTVAGVSITGSADVYYRYNFNDPKGGETNNYTSFTNSHNSFELGAASLQASHSWRKASVLVDLGFGRRAEEFNYTDGDRLDGKDGYHTLSIVKQLNVSYAFSDKLKLTMGKWATHIGYELVDAYLNRNYSMSYLFSYGPFSHTGIKADIGIGGKNALMVGVANTTDNATSLTSRRFLIGQYSTATKNDKLKAYLNYQGSYGGSFSLTQLDGVFTIAATSQLGIGLNGTIQTVKLDGSNSNAWWGAAAYINYDPLSNFGVTLRGEYFDNHKAVVSAPATRIFELTLSPNIKGGNLTVIPELRLDAGKDAVFHQGDGGMSKTTVTGLLAATYHF